MTPQKVGPGSTRRMVVDANFKWRKTTLFSAQFCPKSSEDIQQRVLGMQDPVNMLKDGHMRGSECVSYQNHTGMSNRGVGRKKEDTGNESRKE